MRCRDSKRYLTARVLSRRHCVRANVTDKAVEEARKVLDNEMRHLSAAFFCALALVVVT